MNKDLAHEILSKKLAEWETMPKNDAYEYEKNFLTLMQSLNESLFQLSVGELSIDRNQKKKLQSQLGTIAVPKGHILSPMNGFSQSPYLQETALYLGQGETFAHSSELLERLCGLSLSDKTIENLCHHYGEILEESLIKNSEVIDSKDVTEKLPNSRQNALHYVMVDGSYLLTRQDSWKETKLGRVFKGEDNFLVHQKRSVIRQSSFVSHVGESKDFTPKLATLLDGLTNLVFIADGATWFWNWVSEHYPDSIQILDFWHGYEKICQWAKGHFKEVEKCNLWCEKTKKMLFEGEIKAIIDEIQVIDAQKNNDFKEPLLTYLENNSHRMAYKNYTDKGYIVGSGAVESAQRNVIQQRMKRSGQRWTIKGAQQVLNIRTTRLSNKWENVVKLLRNAA